MNNCAWFALCRSAATTTRPHPILGNVPICTRCNSKMDRIEAMPRATATPEVNHRRPA